MSTPKVLEGITVEDRVRDSLTKADTKIGMMLVTMYDQIGDDTPTNLVLEHGVLANDFIEWWAEPYGPEKDEVGSELFELVAHLHDTMHMDVDPEEDTMTEHQCTLAYDHMGPNDQGELVLDIDMSEHLEECPACRTFIAKVEEAKKEDVPDVVTPVMTTIRNMEDRKMTEERTAADVIGTKLGMVGGKAAKVTYVGGRWVATTGAPATGRFLARVARAVGTTAKVATHQFKEEFNDK